MESRGAMLLSVIPFFIDIVSTVFFCTTCRWPRHFFSHFFCVSYNKYFSVSLLRSIAVQFFILSISYVYIAPAVSFHVQTVVQCWLHSPTLLPWFSCCKGRDFFLFIFYYLPLQLFFVPLVAYAQKRGGRYVIFFACFVQ